MITPTNAGEPRLGTTLGEASAWQMLLGLAARASLGSPVLDGVGVAVDEHGGLLLGPAASSCIVARPSLACGFEAIATLSEAAHTLLELYAPLCLGEASSRLVVAHLGQSLDGRVATVTGASRFVTGPEDLRHTHRLRALFDAVVVGVQTAQVDDPELTTRLVSGPHPTRVVLDPRNRLTPGLRVLCEATAKTIVVRATDTDAREADSSEHVQVLQIPAVNGKFDLHRLLADLRARGLTRIFIEGGGITVSRFLQAKLLDRMHLAVASKIIGSGTPALQLDPIDSMNDALSMRSRRFALGDDLLFDCDLRRRLD